MYHIRQQLKQTLAEQGKFVKELRAHFEHLFGQWKGETQDLALMLLVSSKRGRHLARQWMDDPDLCRPQATATMNGLIARARLYQEELEKP